MTTKLPQPVPQDKHRRQPPIPKAAPGRANVFVVRLVLFWERFWPAILPALAVPTILILISLFGIWQYVPAWLHWITLALSGSVFLSLAWRDARDVLKFPSKRAAQARLEKDGNVKHAPLQSLDDAPFEDAPPDPADDAGSALWNAHLKASRQRARKARFAGIRTNAADRDPLGLRFIAIGMLVIAFIAAGESWQARLQTALAPSNATASGKFAADVWIEPPDYTGKAPIYLLRPGEKLSGLSNQINAPQGSILIAQINGASRPRLKFETKKNEENAKFTRNGNASRGAISLTDSGLITLRQATQEILWPIGILPDLPPRVSYVETPSSTDEGLLSLKLAIADDYGIQTTQLHFRLDPEQERQLDAPHFDEDALSTKRTVDLPDIIGATGERSATLDLQEDPWAGLTILAKIIVTDGAQQIGESDEVAINLPQRKFFNPLAKAVIEQRQTLSVAAKDWKHTGRSFDALTLAPEIFYADDPTDYLLLRAAFWRVMRQGQDGYDDAIEKFWPLALQLEDEALELARQRLEAAEDALRKALESGASDEEVNRLVEELRQAMNDYLTALAQSGQTEESTDTQNTQQLDQSDLDEMLNSIKDLSESGADNAARQMLSELENMLNNLRLSQGSQSNGEGRPGQSGQGQSGEGQGENSAAGKAGDLIGRQRALADQTFERGQSRNPNTNDLSQEQNGISGELEEFIDELQSGGEADPTGEAARALDQARNDMREAGQALDSGDFGAAQGAMERAIGNLRNGTEQLAREQMAQENQGTQGENGSPLDPLGRPTATSGDGVEVPEISDTERTRAVIEDIRRRLGEPGRTQEEIEYLERLLERF